FTIHSYRIRQPFDFANRTGIIAFDVGAKDAIPGGHGFWFNVFVSEEPVPSPYQQGQATALFAKGGLGFEFENVCSGDQTSNTISNIFVEQNYAIVNQIAAPPIGTTPCFKTQEEVMNHVELHISQSHVEVFVSDAGNPQSLRSIMATDVSLNFTRGYVSLQHTHYNAQKCSFTTTTCQDCTNPQCPVLAPYTTYHWDNAGFDGPVLPKPRAYEVPDNNTPAPPSDFGVQTQIVSLSDGGTTSITSFPGPPINTGYQLGTDGLSANQRGIMATNGGAAAPVTLQGVDLTNAADAVLTMNAWDFCDPIQYRFNGGTWRTFSSPFPECDMGARAVAIPVQLSDLKSGDNTLEMYTNTGNGGVVGAIVANIELTVDVH
ncbi:MAG TPA: hypothetical protein VE987_14740, partial [Polyangiaceae bacterium]|nr:hypothetical protein [Polyangiaceae bacterium]